MKRRNIIIYQVMSIFIVCLLGISCVMKSVVVKVISDEVISRVISTRMMDVIFEDIKGLDTQQLITIQESIAKSEAIQNITSDYLDAIIEATVSKEPIASPDISVYFSQLSEETKGTLKQFGYDINDELTNRMKIEMQEKEKNIVKVIDDSIDHLKYQMSSSQIMIFKIYDVMTSLIFQLIFVILLLIFMYKIYAYHHEVVSFFLSISIVFFISGIIFVILFPLIGNSLVSYFSNRYLGRTLMIDQSLFYQIGCLFIFIGLMCLISDRIIKKVNSKKCINMII